MSAAETPRGVTSRSFSTALSYLKGNYAVRRAGWPGWLAMHEGVIRICLPNHLGAAWKPLQVDLLAQDWELA